MRSSELRRLARRVGSPAVAMVVLIQVLAGAVLAESPSPSAAIGDPRSSGQGPGLVGDPLFAVGVVLVIGVATVLASLAYVRFTGGARR